MEENTTVISIIIPVYNRPKLISECLDSVITQTYSNWECIVVDDGSTDNTWDILEDYTSKDKRIKIVKRNREPKGANVCRNIGITKAKGEHLVFLDSDDLLAPWAFNERVQYFLSNPNLDVLLSNGLQFNAAEQKLIDYTALFGECNVLNHFLKLQMVVPITSPTWKSTFIKKNKLNWDERLPCWQDVDFAIQAFSQKPEAEWADITPDYFIRKEFDFNAITSHKNIISKVVSNFYTYEKWIINDKNRSVLENYFPDYILRKLEYLLSKMELDLIMSNHSELIKTHLGNRTVSYLKLYNKTRNIRIIRGVVYHARPYLSNIKRKSVVNREYQFNETAKVELLNKLKEFDSGLFKNYEIA